MLRKSILLLAIIFSANVFANGELIHSGAGPFGGAYGNDNGPFLVQLGFSNSKPNTLNYKTTTITRDLVIRFNEKAIRPLLETPEDYTIVYVNNVIAGSTNPFVGETTSEVRINRNLLKVGSNIIEFKPYISGAAGFPPSYSGVWGIKDIVIEYVESINLTVGNFNNLEYGFNSTPPNYTGLRANFNLPLNNKNLQLTLSGWDIDRSNEVEVYLNGKSLGHLSLSINDQYNFGDHFILEQTDMLIGKNTIEFFLRYPSPSWSGEEFEKWMIRNLRVSNIIVDAGNFIPPIIMLLLDD